MTGQPYWYGTCCYRASESLLKNKARQYPKYYGNARRQRCREDIAAGAIVVLYDKPKPTAELGDVNLDNKVDITDATLVQMHAAKLYTLSDEGEAVADVNGDKKVDISDATLIQMKAAGLNVGF